MVFTQWDDLPSFPSQEIKSPEWMKPMEPGKAGCEGGSRNLVLSFAGVLGVLFRPASWHFAIARGTEHNSVNWWRNQPSVTTLKHQLFCALFSTENSLIDISMSGQEEMELADQLHQNQGLGKSLSMT